MDVSAHSDRGSYLLHIGFFLQNFFCLYPIQFCCVDTRIFHTRSQKQGRKRQNGMFRKEMKSQDTYNWQTPFWQVSLCIPRKCSGDPFWSVWIQSSDAEGCSLTLITAKLYGSYALPCQRNNFSSPFRTMLSPRFRGEYFHFSAARFAPQLQHERTLWKR